MNLISPLAIMWISPLLVYATNVTTGGLRHEEPGRILVSCPGAWQYVSNGQCETCPRGQVSNLKKTGCEYCESGLARGADGYARSGCVAASKVCSGVLKYASYGYCETCGRGQVANALKSGCNYCESGFARGADGYANSGCVAASKVCPSVWKYASYGYCDTCGRGKVADAQKSTCQYCESGFVRGAKGYANSGCVKASKVCPFVLRYAYYGYCATCGRGQVADAQKSGCKYCESGFVRGADGYASKGCVKASTVCSKRQYAYYGYCAACPTGTVSNSRRTECV